MPKKIWWGLIAIGLLLFLYRVRLILAPFFFAVVIAYLLYPLIIAFEARGAQRLSAIFLTYALFTVFFALFLWFFVPKITMELENLLEKLPLWAKSWENMGTGTWLYFKKIKFPAIIEEALAVVIERLEVALEGLAAQAAQGFFHALSHLAALLISPVLAFYFLRDHRVLRERCLQIVPAPYRGEALYIAQEINQALHSFFRGQILISFFVGLLIYAGLALLRIPYALFIGLLAGVFDIIPYFGPLLGFLPAAIFASLRSPLKVAGVALLFILANQLEACFIAPKIIGERVGLHPLVVIFAILAGGHLLGVMGMLLAIPLAAILRVFLQYFLKHRSPG